MGDDEEGAFSNKAETGRRIVKSAWKGSRAVATIIVGGLALAFGAKGEKR